MKRASKVLIGMIIGTILWALCGCENGKDTVSDADIFASAFKNLSNAQEMSYIRTAKDEMGNKSPNCFTSEINCTYQYTPNETLLEGYIDDEQHIVYTTGSAVYTLKGDTYVKDIKTDDALNNAVNTAKTYAMTPSHFVTCELEGNSEVDGIMCQRYHGTNGADSFFTDEYHFMEQTVYVRTDTNTVYYIEIVYTEDESSFSYCGLNPLVVKMKFFDETNIVVPSAIENAVTEEEYTETTTTGVVDMETVDEETEQSLKAGYYLSDGTYSTSPRFDMDFEEIDGNGKLKGTYESATDTYTDADGNVTEEYHVVYYRSIGLDDETIALMDETDVQGTELTIPNYLEAVGEKGISNKTLVELQNAIRDKTMERPDYYDIYNIMVVSPSMTLSEEQIGAIEEYANSKKVKDILADAQNYADLTDDEKAVMFLVAEGLNGYVEVIDGSYRDIYGLVIAYAGIEKNEASVLAYDYCRQNASADVVEAETE